MLRTRLFVAGAVLLSAVTAHAAGKIVVTLDGKPTTSVPVDRLPDIQIKVDAGAAYSKFYKGQWGKLEHALNLSVTGFDKGGLPPSGDSVSGWAVTRIEYTGANKGWGKAKNAESDQTIVEFDLSFNGGKMSHASTLKARRQRQKTRKLLDGEVKQAKRLAKLALAGPAVKKEKVKKVKVNDAKCLAKRTKP